MDTVTAKIELVMRAKDAGVPVISSMGAGNKLDATAFRVADIYETKVCPLARVMRRELKKRKVEHLKVVYSEENRLFRRKNMGRMGMTGMERPRQNLFWVRVRRAETVKGHSWRRDFRMMVRRGRRRKAGKAMWCAARCPAVSLSSLPWRDSSSLGRW